MSIMSAIKGFVFGKAATLQARTRPYLPQSLAAMSATVLERVDVAAALDQHVIDTGRSLKWRQSIVDLMLLCGLEASLEHCMELALELDYSGGLADFITMNAWLLLQVMRNLHKSGGIIPSEFR